jgi:cytidine deaminase
MVKDKGDRGADSVSNCRISPKFCSERATGVGVDDPADPGKTILERTGCRGGEMNTITVGRLIEAARAARLRAHAPFSHFLVGAAIEAEDGRIVAGCNVESASYGLTICAERVAVFKAISEGIRGGVRIAVVADTEIPTPPCGACRQWLWEFGGDLEVVLANLHGEEKARHRMRELLPFPFDAHLLQR